MIRRILFFAFGFLLISVPNGNPLIMDGDKCRPNPLACPVTPNLFPQNENLGDTIRFIFPKDSIVRRLSIALMTPDEKEADIEFIWTGDNAKYDWGKHSGFLVVKGDGNYNCFFLGFRFAGIPENVACKEFLLQIPSDVKVRDIVFSSLPSELVSRTCPMPALEAEINKAHEECRLYPQDLGKTIRFIQLLEKALPKYDCRSAGGYEPIPAWLLADYKSIDCWLGLLYDLIIETKNGFALTIYIRLFDTSTGYFAEGLAYRLLDILHDYPILILENWDSIRDYKMSLLDLRELQGPEENKTIVRIYQEIALTERRFKSICEEIIRAFDIK